jgi:dipeptidyl aminopeptidase/acylaminoacyl peptidase
MKILPSAFLCLILLLITGVQTAISESFTATHMWQMQRVGGLDVSPDGMQAVFTITSYNIDDDNSATDIYLLDIQSGEKRQLTFTGKESNPVWSPDGRKIAFISRRHDGPGQVYVLPLTGGEAEKITDLPVGAYGIKWFPDGKRIAFGANILPEYNGEFDHLKKMIDEKKKSKITAKATEMVMYRYWDRWLTDGYFSRLFTVELATKKVIDLMPQTSTYFNMMGGVSYDISPDGKAIAVSMNVAPPPFENLNYDIFLLPTDGSGKMTNLTPENEASDVNPVFSPDGKKLIYGKQSIYHFYADKVEMVIYDLATGNKKNITTHIDLSCSGWQWSHDGKTIYFDAEYKAMNAIFSIPADGDKQALIFDSGTNSNIRVLNQNKLIFLHNNLNQPVEVYTISTNGKDIRQLTFVNQHILNEINFGKVENVTYKGANDADVQMFIVYPPALMKARNIPLWL